MRNLALFATATIALCAPASPISAQPVDQSQRPAVQVQANPRGFGMESPTPPNPSTAGSPVPPAMPADPSYNAGPYKGALTPPPSSALNRSYPPCTGNLQDACINPGEGGAGQGLATPMHHGVRHSHRR